MENDSDLSVEEFKKALLRRAELVKKDTQTMEHLSDEEEKELDTLIKIIRKHLEKLHPPVYSYKIPEEYHRTCYTCDQVFPTREKMLEHWTLDCEIRKVDNMIAEEIMGWIIGYEGLRNREWFTMDGQNTGWNEHLCTNPFEPAKNFKHTFWVMEKLRKGKDWTFEISNSKNDVSGSYIRIKSTLFSTEFNFPGDADKMPLCICKAILGVRSRERTGV